MPFKKFLAQLGTVTLFAAFVVLLLHLSQRLAVNALLSWVAIAFYSLFCLCVYALAMWASRLPQPQLFTGLTLLTTVGKMGLSVIVVAIYYQAVLPTERLFVIPFLVVYVIYTVFDTYFMMKLSWVNG